MTLQQVRDIFLSITENTHHYGAPVDVTGNYLVWAEDGQGDSTSVDDKVEYQEIEGTLDYFTKIEFDPMFNVIQQTMNNSEMTWKLNSIQYEKDTKYTHYEWVWRIVNKVG